MLRFTKNVRKSGLGKYALRIARSRPIDVAEMTSPQRRGLQAPPPLFTVTSVELGNTTTKYIITATDLQGGRIYLVRKVARLTRGIKRSLPGERVIGSTLWGKELSEEAVAEFVRDVLLTCLEEAKMDGERGLHFAVRSTGSAQASEPRRR